MSVDSQQLQILHQLQQHLLSNNQALYLFFSSSLPIPTSMRLNLYYWLSTLPIPEMSPFAMILILLAGSIPVIVSLFYLVKFVFWLFRKFVPLVLSVFIGKKTFEKKFIQLTFPSDTSKSAYATEQLYTLLHNLAKQKSTLDTLLLKKTLYSLEIVSTKNEGIRYVLVTDEKNLEGIKRSLISFLPGIKIDEIKDYLIDTFSKPLKLIVSELKLSSHFALPLNTQKTLSEHDPISYLTGNMTKLSSSANICFQIVITPVLGHTHQNLIKEMNKLKRQIIQGLPLASNLDNGSFKKFITLPGISLVASVLKVMFKILKLPALFVVSFPWAILDTSGKTVPILYVPPPAPQETLNPYELELSNVIKEKMNQPLFEASIRLMITSNDNDDLDNIHLENRVAGFLAALGPLRSPYQSITEKGALWKSFALKQRLKHFEDRTLASNSVFNPNPVLSASELSDLYHFPYTDTTKTEGLIKSKSKELPAPLSLKKSTANLDVVVGRNNFGGEETLVGLTSSQRGQHTYIIGKTGMGKTTIIKSMVYQDICNGKGVCVLDPHGDMVEELLKVIPESRKNDVIYLNLADKNFPVGLNILNPGTKFSDIEEEHAWIARSLMSVFMKITPKERWGQRMEHILRNATLTALLALHPTDTTPYICLMTIQKLLTDASYRKSISAGLTDPVLKQFWEKEFALYGKMQQADIVGPLTNKLGEFITDHLSRNILLQANSTINLSRIMDEGKVLLVNLSKGNLGEERSAFFGTILTSLIQLAAYGRAGLPESKRKDFFLYIDEFQNFATQSFAEMFSEARKYHVYIIPSHQNIAQIEDPKLAKVISANAGTIICLKSGPDDENFLRPYLEPEVEKGQIINLLPHHFFMKVTNGENDDAFSGETVLLNAEPNNEVANQIIENTRKQYTKPRTEVEKEIGKIFNQEVKAQVSNKRNPRKIHKVRKPTSGQNGYLPGRKFAVQTLKND